MRIAPVFASSLMFSRCAASAPVLRGSLSAAIPRAIATESKGLSYTSSLHDVTSVIDMAASCARSACAICLRRALCRVIFVLHRQPQPGVVAVQPVQQHTAQSRPWSPRTTDKPSLQECLQSVFRRPGCCLHRPCFRQKSDRRLCKYKERKPPRSTHGRPVAVASCAVLRTSGIHAGNSSADRRAISLRRCLMAGVTMATKCDSRTRRCTSDVIR